MPTRFVIENQWLTVPWHLQMSGRVSFFDSQQGAPLRAGGGVVEAVGGQPVAWQVMHHRVQL